MARVNFGENNMQLITFRASGDGNTSLVFFGTRFCGSVEQTKNGLVFVKRDGQLVNLGFFSLSKKCGAEAARQEILRRGLLS